MIKLSVITLSVIKLSVTWLDFSGRVFRAGFLGLTQIKIKLLGNWRNLLRCRCRAQNFAELNTQQPHKLDWVFVWRCFNGRFQGDFFR